MYTSSFKPSRRPHPLKEMASCSFIAANLFSDLFSGCETLKVTAKLLHPQQQRHQHLRLLGLSSQSDFFWEVDGWAFQHQGRKGQKVLKRTSPLFLMMSKKPFTSWSWTFSTKITIITSSRVHCDVWASRLAVNTTWSLVFGSIIRRNCWIRDLGPPPWGGQGCPGLDAGFQVSWLSKDLGKGLLRINSPRIINGNVIWTNHAFSGDMLFLRGEYVDNILIYSPFEARNSHSHMWKLISHPPPSIVAMICDSSTDVGDKHGT